MNPVLHFMRKTRHDSVHNNHRRHAQRDANDRNERNPASTQVAQAENEFVHAKESAVGSGRSAVSDAPNRTELPRLTPDQPRVLAHREPCRPLRGPSH